MFSGIVEEAAKVVALEKEQENLHITLTCSFVNELKIDQSVSHNGVCLTVVKKTNDTYTVTAIQETLLKSNLGLLHRGFGGEPRTQHENGRPARWAYRAGACGPDCRVHRGYRR